jgi:hypothetical protein
LPHRWLVHCILQAGEQFIWVCGNLLKIKFIKYVSLNFGLMGESFRMIKTEGYNDPICRSFGSSAVLAYKTNSDQSKRGVRNECESLEN